ncbi:manganese and iron superoxide dismutase [Dissoconium aciculare CBS 342.82]|uniref:Superoxide dismutase n=1 Tax=Dissoconium aciculare CBS 342.82 TaxID=1314786 RepID=A0A6J3M1R3_9PEZI|nr:manganese and iron superoxide dismutase [Dissoconium aciculare CBS 342.82]KAF1821955.1 manganese and iron superoxide dismutase [Dissoconium aciculare CBS 342.82]
MASALLKQSAVRSALRSANAPMKRAAFASTTFTRSKVTLPDLAYDYGALEPAISGQIMELHHDKHHRTYVNSYNAQQEKMEEAQSKGDITTQIALQPLINFHGGGHTNHTLFWENLAPKSNGGGAPPTGALAKSIDSHYGSLSALQEKFNTALAGIQGSGWAWLVQDVQTGAISIRTYANQDPVVGQFRPLLGIDAWEHAYYLQYQNRKAEYFGAIWEVINWKAAEKRFK